MRKIGIILCILFTELAFSQYNVVHYQYDKLPTDPGTKMYSYDQYLVFNRTESYWFYPTRLRIAAYSDLEKYIANNPIDFVASLWSQGKSNRFYGIHAPISYTSFYQDDAPKINWKILSESKMIMGYRSKKAIGSFRGREYVVWFTEEIPYSYGPWKLRGLPGLILSAKDSDHYFSYNAVMVKIDGKAKPPMVVEQYYNTHQSEAVGYKEVVQNQNKKIESWIRRIAAMSGNQGGALQVDQEANRQFTEEKTFEWQINDSSLKQEQPTLQKKVIYKKVED